MVIWIKYQEKSLVEITEFQDKSHIDCENCEYDINLSSNSELYCAKELEGRSRTQDITTYITNISLDLMLHWIYWKIYTQSYKTVRKKIDELYK